MCVASRNLVAIQSLQGAAQPRVSGPGEAELAMLGDAPLSQRDGVLRVAARGEREIRQRGREWKGEPFVEAFAQRIRKLESGALGDRHTVPQSAVCEEMVVLAFVPTSVGEDRVGEMHGHARRT